MKSGYKFSLIIFMIGLLSLSRLSSGHAETEVLQRRRPPLRQLVLPLPYVPETLNPYLAWDQAEKAVNGFIYESLLSVDPSSGEISPGLAAQWEVDRENLIYTFRLKPDLRWQDGMPFTADDVVFSFQKVLDPETDSFQLRSYYQDIEEVTSTDEQIVRIKLKRPYYLALRALGGLPILPRHLSGGREDDVDPSSFRPLGTGPYKLASRPGSRVITLKTNENYHGPTPGVNRIVFTVGGGLTADKSLVPDLVVLDPLNWVMSGGSTRFSCSHNDAWDGSILSKDDDVVSGLTLGGREYRCLPPAEAGVSAVMLNLNRPYFLDKKVRVALAHLVDKERIFNTVLLGYGRPVESGFYPETLKQGDKLEARVYDPRKAERLLSEAGWEDRDGDGVREKGSITLSFRLYAEEGWGTGLKMAAIISDAASRSGVRIRVVKIGRGELLARLRNGAYDASLVRFEANPYTDPYNFWHSSQTGEGNNYSRFVNAEADYLLERARLEEDGARRSKYQARLRKILHDEVPAIYLFSHRMLLAVSTRLKKYDLNISGMFPYYRAEPRE